MTKPDRLPSTLRRTHQEDMRLLASPFVRFWAGSGLLVALLLPLLL